jgi:hypothetical protein
MRLRSFVAVVVVGFVCVPAGRAVAHRRSHAWEKGDREQAEVLLEQIAAAAEAEPQAPTDADLMYEAVRQWRGEPPGSATIDRVVAQSKREADRNRRALREKIHALFWKDPFADDPGRLIPVRKEDRDLLAAHPAPTRARRERSDRASDRSTDGEVSRLRAELAAARADAAAARAEAEHAREETAHAEAMAARAECVADDGGAAVRRARRHGGGGGGHAHHDAERVDALGAIATRSDRRRSSSSRTLATIAPAPPPAEPIVSAPPPGWRSSDPRGIIVVPIETPAAAARRQP